MEIPRGAGPDTAAQDSGMQVRASHWKGKANSTEGCMQEPPERLRRLDDGRVGGG